MIPETLEAHHNDSNMSSAHISISVSFFVNIYYILSCDNTEEMTLLYIYIYIQCPPLILAPLVNTAAVKINLDCLSFLSFVQKITKF